VRRWDTRVGILLAGLALPLLVGFSRLYLGVHFVSDVLAGWSVGALWVVIVVTAGAVWQQAREQAAARAAPAPPADETEPASRRVAEGSSSEP